MRNERSQAQSTKAWQFFLTEAKVKLVDAKDAAERREWRMAIRSIERLISQNVRLPNAAATQN
jgi:hypothetical protein